MFTTYSHAEIPLGNFDGGLAKTWAFVEQEFREPLLFLEVVRIVNRAKHRTVLMMTGMNEIKQAIDNDGVDFDIERAYVISPGINNGGNCWRMDIISSISETIELPTGRVGIMYETESNLRIYSEPDARQESIKPTTIIHSAKPQKNVTNIIIRNSPRGRQ